MDKCPICGSELNRHFCKYCGYEESNDFLLYRTFQQTTGMDVLQRWELYARIEIRNDRWTPRLSEKERTSQFSKRVEAEEEIPQGFLLDKDGRCLIVYVGKDLMPVVPKSVEVIAAGAFEGMNVKTVILPKGLKTIAERAFSGARINWIQLPHGLKEIRRQAFSDAFIQEINVPGTVEEIGASAFAGCRTLETVRLMQGVKRIGNNAFYGCEMLQKIEIPDSVKEIGEYAFWDCPQLRINASDTWKVLHPNLVKLYY